MRRSKGLSPVRAVHQAVRLLRAAELGAAYESAWEQWAADGDADAWEPAAGDGLVERAPT